MPFNGVLVASTASVSAELWQQVACLPERDRVSSDQLLDLVIGFPLRQLGRWALYVWTYLCVSPYPHRLRSPDSYYGGSSSDDDSDGGGGGTASASSGSTQYYGGRRDYDYSSAHSD
ncbi:uncharacterized protein LOC127251702 [Andrographis paniculata]|uniref:uncharacterized protein LOC127251702 n=1 Tax=Andrographis paniculata TaxID=175694 RepID=UPI0021E7F42A|nr:uncharacterized protein LOC127251702 [Andrographis paniculata]